jgi:hypothetical protein
MENVEHARVRSSFRAGRPSRRQNHYDTIIGANIAGRITKEWPMLSADFLQIDICDGRLRLRDRIAILAQSFEMQLDRFADVAFNFFDVPARGDAAG